jgi:hypothetical protein
VVSPLATDLAVERGAAKRSGEAGGVVVTGPGAPCTVCREEREEAAMARRPSATSARTAARGKAATASRTARHLRELRQRKRIETETEGPRRDCIFLSREPGLGERKRMKRRWRGAEGFSSINRETLNRCSHTHDATWLREIGLH